MKKQTLIQIFCTKMGWLAITCVLAIIFGILTNFIDSEWPYYAMLISFIYPIGLGLIMIAYAWLINPIRERKVAAEASEKKLLVETESSPDYIIMNPISAIEIQPLISPVVNITETSESPKKTTIKKATIKKKIITKKRNNMRNTYFFGWTNIKWFLREIMAIYSTKNSFFSKKRIESGIAFIILQAGMIFWLLKKYDVMVTSDFFIWASIEAVICGYTLNQIQKQKEVELSKNTVEVVPMKGKEEDFSKDEDAV